VMKAVGWRRRDVTRAFLLESSLLSLIGRVVGLALGFGTALAIGYLPAPAASLRETLPGLAIAATPMAPPRLPAHVTPDTLAVALLIAMGGGMLAGWVSARRAAALKPAQALQA